MTLTRQDFNSIAESMKQRVEHSNHHPEVVKVIEDLAVALRSTNPRFDKARFLWACGITPHTV